MLIVKPLTDNFRKKGLLKVILFVFVDFIFNLLRFTVHLAKPIQNKIKQYEKNSGAY